MASGIGHNVSSYFRVVGIKHIDYIEPPRCSPLIYVSEAKGQNAITVYGALTSFESKPKQGMSVVGLKSIVNNLAFRFAAKAITILV